MKTGVFDSRLDFHELPFYEIQGLCENIVATATQKSEDYKIKFEEYKKNITRFSPEFEFCIHELGWMLYDPFSIGVDEVLFSNGERYYVASVDYIKKEGFDRKSIQNQNVGFPMLTDSNVGYDKDMKIENITEGIIDSKGYVDSTFASSIDTLAEIEVMANMIGDEKEYLSYLRGKENYPTKLDYITSKKNVIAAHKLEDGTVSLSFVSENDGKVQKFIDDAKEKELLAELIPIVQNENTSIMKVA